VFLLLFRVLISEREVMIHNILFYFSLKIEHCELEKVGAMTHYKALTANKI